MKCKYLKNGITILCSKNILKIKSKNIKSEIIWSDDIFKILVKVIIIKYIFKWNKYRSSIM